MRRKVGLFALLTVILLTAVRITLNYSGQGNLKMDPQSAPQTTRSGLQVDVATLKPLEARETSGSGEMMEPDNKQTDEATFASTYTSPGDLASEGKVRAIIQRLESETLKESLAKADYVDDFSYASTAELTTKHPLREMHLILSNRRTMKLIEQLRTLDTKERTEVLRRHLHHFMRQYKEMITRFRGLGRQETAALLRDLDFIGRDDKQYKKGLPGTSNAIRSLALISALIADCGLCEEIHGWFQNPAVGFAEDLKAYDETLAQMIFEANPLFSEAFQTQIANITKQRCSHLTGGKALPAALVAKMQTATTVTLRIPHYKSTAGPYDVHHTFGQIPIDESLGMEEFSLLLW